MKSSSSAAPAHHEKFSLPRFILTVTATLAVIAGGLRLSLPEVWDGQFRSPWWSWPAAFLTVSLANCFLEYFFHRYVLHSPAIPFVRRLYRQHSLHHALTHITRKESRDGRGILFIENKFPIVEPEQGEASFFPWYSLAVFAVVLSPLFALMQWLVPAWPWLLAGLAALTASLALYEILHAVNHWPFARWEPLIQHPRWGRFWRPAYAFHLRHHAVTDCNESISGFFGLPVADWVFGTCVIPQTIFAQGEDWAPEKFRRPRPRWLIRVLDRWAEDAVARRRARVREDTAAGAGRDVPSTVSVRDRPYTGGEEIAKWLTHGIGLALSVVGLMVLIVLASSRGDAWHVVSFTVFGLSLLVLYTASTVYHALRDQRAKELFRRVHHTAIFLLIAGTYSPFLLTNLRGPWGWTMFGIVWGLCGAGAVFQLVLRNRYPVATTAAYLFAGWLVVVAVKPVLEHVPAGAVWLLFAGGLCYAVGVVFYLWRRLRYHHSVWHTCVLGGSCCHYLATILFLLPR